MSSFTIDNEFYDRQNRTYGTNSINKFSTIKVGVMGLGQSFASEVLKNLAISGFRHFYLYDENTINDDDINNGFYFRKSDLSKDRVNILKERITELNPTTIITTGTKENINELDHMVLLNQPYEIVSKFEKTFSGKLITGYCTGVNGFVFVNPKEHITNDINGENIISHNIKSISIVDNKIIIETLTKHELSYGDKVTFENMTLTESYNFKNKYNIKVINIYKFSVDLLDNNLSNIFINGSILKTKEYVTFNDYKSFEETLENPTFEGFDFEASQKVIDSYQHIMKFLQPQVMPIISVVGSLVSNEVIKLASDKFTPVKQILTFSDSSLEKITNDGNFLSSIYEKIKKQNYNMVGCGAIGCELLKNLSMIGAGTEGFFRVTDPDHIEKSNLSRQFLFRQHHVGNSKAKVAGMMVQEFNNKINIETFEKKITPKDESFVNTFFKDTNIIFNALDNLEARKYVDSIAFKYNLPLFESGTMGMKGNTQPIIPFMTETYSDSTDAPDEDNFPVCTIKNFPNMIQHTIHWARDNFEEFNRGPTNVKMYLRDSSYVDSLVGIEKNTAIMDINLYGSNFSDWFSCAEYSYNIWYKHFNYSIKQLLNSFPSDKLNKDDTLFWSHGKKCPKILEFDTNNSYHVDYLTSMTRILCNICMIETINVSDEMIIGKISEYNMEEFMVDSKKKAASNDEEMKKMESSYVEIELKKDLVFNTDYINQVFEKDDDMNHHVKFLTASSNCRAENYSIVPSDFNKTKGIAGKIIPAVATTTSLVSGLIVLEMIKYVAGMESIEDYKSYFVNLAINTFIGGEPMPSKKIKIGEKEMNSWTKFEQTEDITLKTFLEKWSKVLDTEVNMIFSGSKIIYSNFTKCDTCVLLSKIISDKFKKDAFNITEEWIISSDEYEDLPSVNIVLKKNESNTLNI
tara:strand:- start:1028 stop:3772 length:2745 start_codon:yes stop_codon:yes gene_type:complete